MDTVDNVIVERDAGVVTVTLNRPGRKNALTRGMVDELTMVLEDVGKRLSDRVVVLAGAGEDFCSGADLADKDSPAVGDAEAALAWVRRLGALAVALHRLQKPTVAMVDGVAVGAGLGLAIGCDLVVASDRARLSMIFSRRALSPDGATSWLLPRLVGTARAKELAFFGEMVDAARAQRLGLVNHVVPPDELASTAATWARRLADGPALALSLTKKLLDEAWSTSLADAVEREAEYQARNLCGDDAAEAFAAFVEKRPPRFAPPDAG